METKDIQHLYASHPGVDALMQLREEGSRKKVLLEGLLGSSAAMVLCGLRERAPGQTFFVVMNDAEEAGYFYHEECLSRGPLSQPAQDHSCAAAQ